MDEQNNVLDKFESILDEYEIKVLPEDSKGALKYLSYVETDLNGMTYEECGIATVMLSNLAYHVHRCIQKEKAKLNYLKERLMKTIAPIMGQYTGYKSTEEKAALASEEDDFAQALKRNIVICQGKIDRIDYLPIRLEHCAQSFSKLQETKRRRT